MFSHCYELFRSEIAMLASTLITGYRGEQLAARHLRNNGCDIIASNFAVKEGEIDIITIENNTLCFVEVKTRSPGAMFPPADAVDYYKQSRIKSAAAIFTKQSGLQKLKQRFDICEVILRNLNDADITYHENAF